MESKEGRTSLSYLELNLQFLSFFGTWRNILAKNPFFRVISKLNIYLIRILTIYAICHNILNFIFGKQNYEELLEIIIFTNFLTTITLGQIFVMINNTKINKIIQLFDKIYINGLKLCGETAFRPVWNSSEKASRLFSFFFIFGSLAATMLFNLFPKISSLMDTNSNSTNIVSPMATTWYPVDMSVRFNLELFYIIQFFIPFIVVYNETSIDSFLISMLFFIRAHLENLNDILRSLPLHINPETTLKEYEILDKKWKLTMEKTIDSKPVKENTKATIELCIIQHNLIIELIEMFTKKIMSPLMAILMIKSCISIAISLFQAAEVEITDPKFTMYMLVCSFYSSELYYFSWAADNMTISGANLINGAYNSFWIEASQDFRKKLILFMIRCQDPPKIPAGPFFYMSTPFFVEIERLCFSAYTFLKHAK